VARHAVVGPAGVVELLQLAFAHRAFLPLQLERWKVGSFSRSQ
jgi:hypothetical protein